MNILKRCMRLSTDEVYCRRTLRMRTWICFKFHSARSQVGPSQNLWYSARADRSHHRRFDRLHLICITTLFNRVFHMSRAYSSQRTKYDWKCWRSSQDITNFNIEDLDPYGKRGKEWVSPIKTLNSCKKFQKLNYNASSCWKREHSFSQETFVGIISNLRFESAERFDKFFLIRVRWKIRWYQTGQKKKKLWWVIDRCE